MADSQESRGHISAEVAAALIRVTPRWLQKLAADGWVKREARGQYTIKNTVHGYLDFRDDEARKATKTDGDKRVRDARAREIELRTAREENELVPIEEATAFVQGVIGAMTSRLNGLPAQITRDLNERRRIETILDRVRAEMDAKLAELAATYRNGPAADPADSED
jgi:hypothetical protein